MGLRTREKDLTLRCWLGWAGDSTGPEAGVGGRIVFEAAQGHLGGGVELAVVDTSLNPLERRLGWRQQSGSCHPTDGTLMVRVGGTHQRG